ncbi:MULTISPECIES: GNAT family N-acetyltransferase [Aliivibrio]|uniref:N-acetyltransferase n=1 Tax=Aliivibrio finisterrensis TaxID=511998 RepID=A0A4Q5KLY3_9GAMM|nr:MULTISPECIES: GNAT family N-acetyltransferase [Aliivibrio]KAB2823098.1 GNAT family N-acetyltransferase [Aliivibrio finisterrensis]MDD9180697.1 GNAT family N-acetyltransferase [Aliivibrio sp. A6]RYU47431.1 N-acetyltransferase [Aliivibrio finisterrensis]RYU48285.1 N-acetyltransferase [Aliivibrio finisterrensis]RYU52951.1 N-acetyltransferase [Aliivibrio finisterrensis]
MNLTVSHLDKLRLPLLHKLYKANYPSGKPKGKEDIIALENNKIIIGAVRIKTYEDCHFLTGMMIIEEMRGKQLGNYLINETKKLLSLNHCYCLCDPQLTAFYLKNNFTLAKESIPHVITSKYERYTHGGKKLDILVYKKHNN